MYATIVRRYGQLAIVQELSHLSGSPTSARPQRLYVLDAPGVKVSIFGLKGVPYAVSLPDYAHTLSRINEVLEQSTGTPSPVRELAVILVPAGTAYESRSTSLQGRRLVFSLREFKGEADTVSDSVRTIAHEVFHLGVAVNFGVKPGRDNERAAISAESCVELALTGRTAGAMPTDVGRDAQMETDSVAPVSNSISARYGPDDELRGLFQDGPITRLDDPRSKSLLSLCRKRAEQLRG